MMTAVPGREGKGRGGEWEGAVWTKMDHPQALDIAYKYDVIYI